MPRLRLTSTADRDHTSRPSTVRHFPPCRIDHIIRRVLRDRGYADESILARVLRGKLPLVSVGHPVAIRSKRIAPHVRFAGKDLRGPRTPIPLPWASVFLPTSRRLRHRHRCTTGYLFFSRMTPISSGNVVPPLQEVVHDDRMIRWRKYHGTRNQVLVLT